MTYTELTVFERELTLNYSPLTTYLSLKNINRLHKWHPYFYFSDPGPHLLENTYIDYYQQPHNYNYVIVTNFFNMLDGDIFFRKLTFLHRAIGENFSVSRNKLDLEFDYVEDNEEATKINVVRRLIVSGNPDSVENQNSISNAYDRTDLIFRTIQELEPFGNDGLLCYKNKPAGPQR